MTRDDAHELLNAAVEGADVTESQITRCLAATGDLAGTNFHRHDFDDEDSDAADRVHSALLRSARRMLDRAGIGEVADAFAIQWAETMLRQNVQRSAALGIEP